MECESVTVVDVTGDIDEPDIASVARTDVAVLDGKLRRDIEAVFATSGRSLTRWMESNLNEGVGQANLITPYTLPDCGSANWSMPSWDKSKSMRMGTTGSNWSAKAASQARLQYWTLGLRHGK